MKVRVGRAATGGDTGAGRARRSALAWFMSSAFGGVRVGVLPPARLAALGGGVSLKLSPRSSTPPCTFLSTSIYVAKGGGGKAGRDASTFRCQRVGNFPCGGRHAAGQAYCPAKRWGCLLPIAADRCRCCGLAWLSRIR